MLTVSALVAVLAIVLLFASARRAMTVADLLVRDGSVRVLSGGIAPSLLADLGDVAQRPPIRHARIRIVRSRGRAEVTIRGQLTPAQSQQIRNVIGSVPLARLSNARRRR
jgi:hypothetical protein